MAHMQNFVAHSRKFIAELIFFIAEIIMKFINAINNLYVISFYFKLCFKTSLHIAYNSL